MNIAFFLKDFRALPLMKQLGYANGKKEGDGLGEEAIEVAKRHPDWVEIIGETKDDADLLAGNLREQGLKILNCNELKRRKNK